MLNVKPKKLLTEQDAQQVSIERRKQALSSVHDTDVSRTTVVLSKGVFKRYKQFLVNEDHKMRSHLEELIVKHLDEYDASKKGE